MAKFEAGKEYSFNWYCEDGGTSRLTIVSRTEKTVVISYKGEQKRKKIYVDSNGEYIMPTGSYSMAPICRAENICETEIETENTQEEKTMTVEQVIETIKGTESVRYGMQILDGYKIAELEEIAKKAQCEHNFEDDYTRMKNNSFDKATIKLWLKIWIREELSNIKVFRV